MDVKIAQRGLKRSHVPHFVPNSFIYPILSTPALTSQQTTLETNPSKVFHPLGFFRILASPPLKSMVIKTKRNNRYGDLVVHFGPLNIILLSISNTLSLFFFLPYQDLRMYLACLFWPISLLKKKA